MGKEFRSILAVWLWLRVFYEIEVKILTEDVVIWGLDWVGEMVHAQLLQGPSVTCHMASLQVSLSVLIAWQLTSSRASDLQESKEEAAMSFMTWSWCYILWFLPHSVP